MFEKITPEAAGIPSSKIQKFISLLERRGARTHSVLMMRGGKILAEYYWAPFDKDFCHRMYSQTKSFVGVAIGLLLEEGKLTLDDKIVSHFPEKIDREIPRYLGELTVREMLTMTTAGTNENWFTYGDPDRTHLYMSKNKANHPSGTLWEYDSAGSQVLSSLVEKLSGMSLLEYMKKKLFNRMGTFQTANVLKTPSGDSWGDSAMLCTTRDMASFGHLCQRYGEWEGEQLMSREYLKEATSRIVDNCEHTQGGVFNHGYGYQIWRTEQNGFAFVGMGHQFTVCLPDRDFVFVITSDNQGPLNSAHREQIISGLFDIVVASMKDETLAEDKAAEAALAKATSDLKLRSLHGYEDVEFREELSDKVYLCTENPMGITKLSFHFSSADEGEFRYTNAQGDKVIPFGINHNVFGKFPELGYSDGVGATVTTDGFMYRDAVSAAWTEEKKLVLLVQVIDRYFGSMWAMFSFKGDEVYARFEKDAEHFFNEYVGRLVGKRQ